MKFRFEKREDRIDSNFSLVQVSNSVGDGSGQLDGIQANKNPKTKYKGNPDGTEKPV